jgi:hypothetical protein
MPSARWRWRALGLPLLTLLVVIGIDASSRQWTYVAFAAVVPLVAANLSGPRATSVWAGLALAAGGFSVWWDHLYDQSHGGTVGVVTRPAGVLFAGTVSILISRHRAETRRLRAPSRSRNRQPDANR